MRFASVLKGTLVLLPIVSEAQTVSTATPSWPVAVGARVRVSSPALGDKRQVGVVAAATSDTLSFRAGDRPAYTSIATSDIRQLEISQGTRNHRVLGAVVGFPLGAVLGGFMGAATVEKGNGDARFEAGTVGAVAGGLLGAVAGALVIGRTVDTWVPVVLPNR